MGRGMNWDQAASRERVRTRGADPVTTGFKKARKKRRKVEWKWITAKKAGVCVSNSDHEIAVGDRIRWQVGRGIVQCEECGTKFEKGTN